MLLRIVRSNCLSWQSEEQTSVAGNSWVSVELSYLTQCGFVTSPAASRTTLRQAVPRSLLRHTTSIPFNGFLDHTRYRLFPHPASLQFYCQPLRQLRAPVASVQFCTEQLLAMHGMTSHAYVNLCPFRIMAACSILHPRTAASVCISTRSPSLATLQSPQWCVCEA